MTCLYLNHFDHVSMSDNMVVPMNRKMKVDLMSEMAFTLVDKIQKALHTELDNTAIFVANQYAGWTYGGPQLDAVIQGGMNKVQTFQATAWFPAAIQGEISIEHKTSGIAKTFSSGSWSAVHALEALFMSSSDFSSALLIGADAITLDFQKKVCHEKLGFSSGIYWTKDKSIDSIAEVSITNAEADTDILINDESPLESSNLLTSFVEVVKHCDSNIRFVDRVGNTSATFQTRRIK